MNRQVHIDINKSFVNSIVTRVGSSEKLYPPQNYNKQLWKKINFLLFPIYFYVGVSKL